MGINELGRYQEFPQRVSRGRRSDETGVHGSAQRRRITAGCDSARSQYEEPQETNYVIVKESEKTLEQLTMEAMRRVALVGSGISGVVIFLCIFWQQIRPCIVCCAKRLNFVRIAK